MKRLQTALGDMASARKMAFDLVKGRLASCVHITPIISVYRWNGSLHEDEEFILSILTSDARIHETRRRILELHPYELPVIEISTVDMTDEASAWVLKETTAPDA